MEQETIQHNNLKSFWPKNRRFFIILGMSITMNQSFLLKKLKRKELHNKIDKRKIFFFLLKNVNIPWYVLMKAFLYLRKFEFPVFVMTVNKKLQYEHINIQKLVYVVVGDKLNRIKVHGNMLLKHGYV